MENQIPKPRILIVYDPRIRTVVDLAECIAGGVVKASGLPSLCSTGMVTIEEMKEADGMAIGSANWTGITAATKAWFDSLGNQWENGDFIGKAGAAFAVGDSPGAGMEFTLSSIIHWMMANGMIPVGLPWMEEMKQGGSYYGATACGTVLDKDIKMARVLGCRLTQVARGLQNVSADDVNIVV